MSINSLLVSGLDKKNFEERLEGIYKEWFVPCAISGVEIPLNELRYWRVESQQCFANPSTFNEEQLERYYELTPYKKPL